MKLRNVSQIEYEEESRVICAAQTEQLIDIMKNFGWQWNGKETCEDSHTDAVKMYFFRPRNLWNINQLTALENEYFKTFMMAEVSCPATLPEFEKWVNSRPGESKKKIVFAVSSVFALASLILFCYSVVTWTMPVSRASFYINTHKYVLIIISALLMLYGVVLFISGIKTKFLPTKHETESDSGWMKKQREEYLALELENNKQQMEYKAYSDKISRMQSILLQARNLLYGIANIK